MTLAGDMPGEALTPAPDDDGFAVHY